MIKKIFFALITLLVISQFVRIDKTVPKVTIKDSFVSIFNPPEEVKEILTDHCYDCHTYQTTYPWYSEIAPISWWIGHHIEEGREELNLSEWANYSEEKANHKLEEMYEEVEEGEMPLSSYNITHGNLSHEEKETLENWLKTLIKED